MSRVFRRFASTKASASEAAEEILARFGDKPISVREQFLDANQARLLSLALGRPKLHASDKLHADGTPMKGTPIPPGYHWVYFTPTFLEQDLGDDGTDKTLNPLRPWTRRMWAGGELQWRQESSQVLRVGSTVTEITRITSAEAKTNRNGEGMILAGLEKTYESDNGVALVDKRNWVFQHELTESKQPPPKPEEKALPEGMSIA
jgi:hydroxyacyl-ACP dehydratase HTD2-like protein with hotdog domain